MARRLLFLNGLAIISVVLFHTSGMGFVAMLSWGHQYLPVGVSPGSQIGSASYYGLRFIEQLVVFSIPAFLFVSGYSTAIAAGRSQKNLNWQFVLNRIKSLLIPYLIWSHVVLSMRVLEGKNYTIGSYLAILLTGSASEVLYFVPLLIQFYLLSPVFVNLARKNWRILLLVTGFLQIIVISITYLPVLELPASQISTLVSLTPKWIFLSRIFWFPLGIVAGFNSNRFKLFTEKYWRISLVLAIVFIPLGILEWETIFRLSGQDWISHRETLTDTIYSIAIIIPFLALNRPMEKWYEMISSIGVRSYGIYLTHAIFIELTARTIYHFAPGLLGYQILLQPTLILVGLGLPLLLMKLADITPVRRVYNYLYG